MAKVNQTLICGREVSRRQFEISFEVDENDYDEDLILVDRNILIDHLTRLLEFDNVSESLNAYIVQLRG